MNTMKLRDHDVTWREIDGDLVILDLRSGSYLVANSSGTILMKELVDERTEADLARSLVAEFGISAPQAHADVRSFISTLAEGGLLEHE